MILSTLFAAVSVAGAPFDGAYDRCMKKAVTNPDFAACGAALLSREDAELNRVWKTVYAKLDADTKAPLLAEQRAWNGWKEKSCLYWTSGAYGREGQVIHFYACRAGVIEARIAYLKGVGVR